MQAQKIQPEGGTKRVMSEPQGIGTAMTASRGIGRTRDWQHWAPYAAVTWSVVYGLLGLYWAVSGRGFPYAPGLAPENTGPIAGRFGLEAAWIIVIAAGIPAAVLGSVMLRGVRRPRLLLISAGGLLAAVLLLFMTDMNVLILIAYIPYSLVSLFKGDELGKTLLEGWKQWTLVHQLVCLAGGFFWLAATTSYARRSGETCLYCGRGDGPEGWTSPDNARRWGRIAVIAAMTAPVIYALTRYAWALGIPLGMSKEHWSLGQARGMWTSGLFLATFGLVGALLMLGLVQRWGEVFPRWMIGLAGRRVPIALAVVPASIAAVLLVVTGISIISGSAQLAAGAAATGENLWIVVGPTFLFPVWGVGLAVATLGYYYRRRGPCMACSRGASIELKG